MKSRPQRRPLNPTFKSQSS